ncbi:MAG TPA: BTAD domain-containing putative transcriptional regulator, partial [Gemmatimonadaceae bacterium]|nr:BTAD domain-containing putative transcriptional regulator [Gemmatimonadaceae bacterium]
MLVVLAVAGDTGLSRDKLIGLLWPDVDEERARHSLTQALYAARRALKIDDLFTATSSDVRLNAARLPSDVRELEHQLAAGELENAAALYQGPFLDGFFLSGAPEFDQWVTAQRERLESRVADALDRLANEAEGNGDRRRALEWRRRLAALRPFDSGSAVALMKAMAVLGDRAGALQHARVHAALLREQLELEPDPIVEALAATLREGGAQELPAAGADTSRVSRPALLIPSSSGTEVESAGPPHSVPTEVGVWVPRRRTPPLWLRWAVLVLLLTGLVGAGVWLGRRSRTSTVTIEPLAVRQRVVVAPFRVAGAEASLSYLREGIVELLSTRLADDTAARSVDAGAVLGAWRAAGLMKSAEVTRDTVVKLATRLGAERVVTGSVVGSRSRVVLNASVLLLPQGTVSAQASVSGPADSITTLLDRLAARLLVNEAGQDESLVHYTTRSLPALKAFLAGQTAFRRNEYADALGDYDRALRRDSSFALAALYKALSADRLSLEPALRHGLSLAWRSLDELTEKDRSLLLAFVGPRYPALPTSAEQTAAWQRTIDLAPSSADAWYSLGARLLKDGAAAGMPSPRVQAVSALRRALSANAEHLPAQRLLARLVAPAGDTGAPHQVARNLSRLATAELRVLAMASQFDASGLTEGAQALAILRSRASRASSRIDVALAEHSLAVNRGRVADALEATTRLRRIQPGADAWLRLRVLDGLYADGDSAAAEEAARTL